jgi:hypothetical protein
MLRNLLNHLNVIIVGCTLLFVVGLMGCTKEQQESDFTKELLEHPPFSIDTKDTIQGILYIREGCTYNYKFKVIKTYQKTYVEYKGMVAKIDCSSSIDPASREYLIAVREMTDTELEFALQCIKRKSNWETEEYLKLEVSPERGNIEVPIIPKSAN